MELKFIQKNNENILAVTFYGKNRNSEVLKYQKKVFEHFNFHINYIEWPFHITGHGQAIQYLIDQTINLPIDYYLFIDMDAIAIRPDFIDDIYDKIKDKKTVYGPAWTSNHKSPLHIHAASCFIAFSKKIYIDLEKPNMTDMIPRSDTGEELSYAVSENGYNLCLVYPQSFYELTDDEMNITGNPKYWKLGGRLKYGLMTQYSDIFIHCGMQNIQRGNDLFIEKCKSILGLTRSQDEKIECVTVCVNRSKFLEITYFENKKHFDNFIVITSDEDIDTQNFCLKHNIDCEITNRFYEGNAIFNKGGAINEGLKKLKYNDFCCHLDVDIVLSNDFREKLNINKLDTDTLYGCRRFFIEKYTDWLDYKLNKKNKGNFTGLQWGGWGCGYIQIWNMKSDKIKNIDINDLYPSYFTASESDIFFLKRFHPDVNNVGKLDIDVCHLGDSGVSHDGLEKPHIKFFNTNE